MNQRHAFISVPLLHTKGHLYTQIMDFLKIYIIFARCMSNRIQV